MQILFKVYLQETSTFFKDDAVESVLFLNSQRNKRFRKIGRKTKLTRILVIQLLKD